MHSVVVTGASRGIGLGIAEALAMSSHRVIAIARSEGDALPALRRRVESAGVGALHFRAFDLTDIEGIPALVRGLRTEFGPLYGLVNNAAGAASGLLATTPDTAIARLVRLNVLSPLMITKHVVRSMITGRGGRVVNISSVVTATGYSGLALYAATKSSLAGLTRSLARELGPLGITVNAVAPGFIDTELTSGLEDRVRAKIARRNALGRAPQIADVAAAVAFLFSEAARNVTGTVLTVDAGNTA